MTHAGRVALVTGAGRGIGREVALDLGARGFAVMLAARTAGEMDRVASQIHADGGKAAVCACDVSEPDEVRRLFAATDAAFGGLGVLVNNAGMGRFVPTVETTEELWDATLDTNLKGAFLCSREAVPRFEKAGGGLIINIASVVAVRGFANCAAYAASKAGLLGMSRSMREELRKKGIRISVVMPGATDSSFWDHVTGNWDRGRMMSAADIARVIGDIAVQPPNMTTEEVLLMPAGGAL